MRKTAVAVLVVLLVIIIIGGFFSWNYYNSKNQNKTTSQLTVEQIRDRAIAYIAANHTDTVQLMQNLTWSGGRQETGLLGSETYLYNSGNWSLQIQYPVVPNPTYSISANYSSQGDTVNWAGTYNGALTETNQTINVQNVTLSPPEQIRDVAMLYISAYHNETAYYMQNVSSLPWFGGRATPEGLVGSETYGYLHGGSAGWAVNIQYPVVPNPIYSINATYSAVGSNIISWEGTFQNGAVLETAYNFSP